MTFSIVAHEAETQSWGVAAASKFLAVGALVGAARAGVGAVASQATPNLAYRAEALRLLADGASAPEAAAELVAADPGKPDRQLGVVDATGRAATFTGERCLPWAGGVAGDGFAIQGNLLAGPEVVADMRAAFLASAGQPLARRLHAALTAGDAAGGDRRGRQSACLLVVSSAGGLAPETDVLADLRVDDHAAPVAELGRLLDVHELYFGKSDPAALLTLTGATAQEVRGRLGRLGHDGGDLDGALARWATIENLEARLTPGHIDPVLLRELRRHTAEPA